MDVSIGDPDYTNINDASMLPVTSGDIDFEGDPRMSALTKNLMKVLDKLYNEDVPYEDRLIHQQEIQELSYAIRTLVNRKSVDALITSAMNRVKSYIKDIKEVQDVIDKQVKDGKFDRQTVGDLVARISDAKISLETFKDMRNNLAEFIKDMDPDEKEAVNKQLDKINVNITEAVNMMYDKNTGLGILEKAGIKIGEDIGIFNIMSPDRELAWDQQMWNTHSSIPIKTGAAYSKIRSTVEHRINMRTSELAYELGDIQKSIEEWMGGTWDDKQLIEAICKKDKDGNWTPYLVNKISKDFYDNLKSAMETSNSKWILKNIDTVAYKEAYATQLERVKKRADEKIFDAGSYREDPSKRKGTLDQERREKYVQWFIDTFDISRPTAFTYKNSWLKNYASKENWSEEYKNIQSVEPLKKLYSYVTELNKRAHKSGMLGDYYIHFLPQMRKRTMDAALHFNGADMKRSLISNFVVEEGDKRYRDEFTGEPVNKLRGKYIYDLKDEKKGYSGVDTDLMKALTLYTKEVIAHEEKSNEEGVIKALLAMEKNKRVLATHQGQVLERQGRPVTKESTVNYEWLEKEIIGSFYDDKYQGDDPGITVMVDGKPMHLSAKKSIDAFVQGFTLKSLGLNPMSAISNIFGGAVNAFINSGKYFTSGELMEAYRRIPECKFYTEEGKKLVSLLNHFVPFTEDIAQHLGKNASKNQVVEWLSGDGLMVLMRKSDNIVQMANALAYFENTMIENGKLVNIREYVKRKNGYYEMFESKNSSKYSQEDRAEMRKKIEAEVKELQNSRNLINDANIKYAEDTFGIDWSVPKLDPSELQLRQQIQQLTRDCLGNRTPDEFAHINSFLIGSAAMNFRNWIPRLAQKRYGRFKYNAGHGTYEQGRMHSVMQAVNDHAQSKLKNIVDVLGYANLGSNENTIIGAAQRQYQRRVAEARFQEQTTESMFERTVSEGEFVENFVRDVKAQVRELQFTVALMASFFAALAFAKSVNKDDDNFAQRGAIKWGMRMLDKFSDELGFFYSPMSTKTIIGSGSILPSFSVFTDLSRFLINIGKEGYFLSTGDEDSEEKNHVLKYAINYVPVVNQVSAYSAMIWEDYAKAMGKSTMGYEWGGFQR
jgi:flagellar hook-basal body complex protein FliE/tetrahydromethanopterin S-methyltransferase subunit G